MVRYCLLPASWIAPALLLAQEPPRVVELSPPHLACEVDAAATAMLRVVFDRPMQQHGFSFCGGGPGLPKFRGKPEWQDPRTIVVTVELEPDHDYALSVNCPNGTNFRSEQGQVLAPVPWRFTTLPQELPDPELQRQRNERALGDLLRTLELYYSHRELRVRDWGRLRREHEAALLAARTDVSWAARAAAMLAPTQDLHLQLRLGERTFAVAQRAVDPLWRRKQIERHLQLRQIGELVVWGRTRDDIGYLAVGAWVRALDLEALEAALASLRSCRAIIVDTRSNNGGDERLAQRVAAWFVAGEKVYARHRVRDGAQGFGPVQERTIVGNSAAERRFPVPIAVLTGPGVVSANESFVLMLRQAADCTVIGQPTCGSSGNPKPFELANGVTVLVPTWQDLRPDGTCFEGEGLQPDELVPCTSEELTQRDPILERALHLLRSR